MKVVHVISGLRSGGAEHFVLELCREAQRQQQHDISVLTLGGAADIAGKFNESNIHVITSASDGSRSFKAWQGLRALLKVKPGIIHAHMFHACMVACIAKFFQPSVKLFFTLHNNHVPKLHRRLLLWFTRPLRDADIVLPGLARKWFQKSAVAVIPVAIDVKRFDHMPPRKPPVFTCTFLGRLNPEKNPLALIGIAHALLPEHNFLIRVAGDGPLFSVLQRQIAEQSLTEHFILHRQVNDVRQLLAESHCVLITSHWEGMPLALLEAGAAGIPVVATPVGSIPFLLNDSNGYVGRVEDFPSLITKVMDNYGEALIKARKLMHEVHDNYSIAKCFQQHIDLYLHS